MEIPYEVTARRDTGLYNSKIGIWLFLASEVMLFGGLFSAYVFLRVGIDPGQGDIPWPVAVQKVWIGFTNTLVLIASSVFVVISWLALKERNWRKFQWWMSAVIGCALIFMALKAYEYTYKFSHHGIILQDGSVLEGVIKNKSDKIEFEADTVTMNLSGALPGFAGQVYKKSVDDKGQVHFNRISIDDLHLKGPLGESSDSLGTGDIPNFKRWFYQQRSRVNRELADVRRARRNGEEPDFEVVATAELTVVERIEVEKSDADEDAETEGDADADADDDADTDGDDEVDDDTEGDAEEEEIVIEEVPSTFLFMANPRFLQGHTEDSLSFKDAATAKGTLKNDTVAFEIHELDLQMIPFEKQEDASAWELIESFSGGDEQKEHWFEARDEVLAPIAEWYESRGRAVPRAQKQSHDVSIHPIHLNHGAKGGHGGKAEHGDGDSHAKPSDPGDAGSESGGDHEAHLLQVPRDQIKFMSNHGPRYHPYYAIYFTLTGLHGLHVIGGALVLAYMMIFGKKLFLRNPEHMANRVEVGGLFWHFVDLVWIFLFPIMYLF